MKINVGQDGSVKRARIIEGSDLFPVTDDIVQDKITGLFWHINANLPDTGADDFEAESDGENSDYR
jgi:hypothetical protein